METVSPILETGNVILFLISFLALALVPMFRQRRKIRKLREHTEMLEKAIERLELEKDVYNPANHHINLSEDKSELAEVSQKYTQ